MPRPKSILRRVAVTEAGRSHNCQHNSRHRVTRGAKRLTVWNQRSGDHYCLECGINIIERDQQKLQALARALRSGDE